MSKWTLEKIKSTIQAGDRFSYQRFDEELIVNISDSGFAFYDSRYNGLNTYRGKQPWENFKFYRNGEEILPPKERELIKFTEKLVDSRMVFISDDNGVVYQSAAKLFLGSRLCDVLIEEIPNARVLYRYADDLTISHWGEK